MNDRQQWITHSLAETVLNLLIFQYFYFFSFFSFSFSFFCKQIIQIRLRHRKRINFTTLNRMDSSVDWRRVIGQFSHVRNSRRFQSPLGLSTLQPSQSSAPFNQQRVKCSLLSKINFPTHHSLSVLEWLRKWLSGGFASHLNKIKVWLIYYDPNWGDLC